VSLNFEFTNHCLNEERSELGERTWHPAPAVPGALRRPNFRLKRFFALEIAVSEKKSVSLNPLKRNAH